MSQRELKIEVGKKYKDKQGYIIKIVLEHHEGFVGEDEYGGEYSYDKNGNHNSRGNWSLIEEVKE